MATTKRISSNLWFANDAEEAVNFYLSVFKNASIIRTTYYGKAGYEFHKMPAGTIMTIEFELDGVSFVALNGGPVFKFNEAVSFIVNCKDQEEIDYYWEKLTEGGDKNAQQCGWLKDKFGVSWQVVPEMMDEMFESGKMIINEKSERAMNAMMQMKKINIQQLMDAYEGRQ